MTYVFFLEYKKKINHQTTKLTTLVPKDDQMLATDGQSRRMCLIQGFTTLNVRLLHTFLIPHRNKYNTCFTIKVWTYNGKPVGTTQHGIIYYYVTS